MCETCVKVFERVVPTVVGVAVCSGCGCVQWVWLCAVGVAVYSGCGKAVGFVAVL